MPAHALAAQKAIESCLSEGDRRIGVVSHTTGSGKALSMLFLVGILRQVPELENPTFVLQVDQTDLDTALRDQRLAGRSLVGNVKHAQSVEHLRELLRTGGGEIVVSTIEKFRLKGPEGEFEHPVLSTRMNVIVRRDTGEDWNEYLRRLMQEQGGVENPTDEDLRRLDRKRHDKRVSNKEWMSPTDPDSRIAKMKDAPHASGVQGGTRRRPGDGAGAGGLDSPRR